MEPGSVFLMRFFCGLSLLSQLSRAQQASVDGAGDREALMGFQKEADSEGVLSGSWNVSVVADHCRWDGILCNGEKRVIRVELNGRRLKGTFAANTLSRLTELQVLTLSSNSFAGPFPSDLASLTGLLQFWAENSTFSGPFPAFGIGARLQKLGLSGNKLTGPIPDLTSLKRLKILDASHNSFEGPIPSLPSSLAELNLSRNGLSGSFPDFPRNDASLRALDLSSNNLTGQLPNLAGLNNLKTLDLSHNFFEGRIPPLPSDLGTLNLSYNSLTGIIPTEASRFGVESFRGTAVSDVSSPATNLNTSEPPAKSKSKLSSLDIVFMAVGVVVLLSVMAFCLKKFLARREADLAAGKGSEENEDDSGKMATTSLEKADRSKLSFMDESQHGYDLEDLLRASAEMLGKGSFGTAYKAVLDSGVIVAVKRLRDATDMRKKDFDQHMTMLGKLRHPNLVPLRAYYNAREEKLLIYDFMPNGNLFSLLHGNRGPDRTPLEWPARLSIAQGVAMGLTYLHQQREPNKIPHGNMKSSNVLMGKNFEVCISDFGLVPLMPSHIAAQRMAAYRAPEYRYFKKINHKADVYSFGVLLMELLTGRQPAQSISDNSDDLPKWVHSMVREEWTGEVFDLELKSYLYREDDMMTLLKIAMSCVEPEPDQRPEMADVLEVLDEIQRGDSVLDDSLHSNYSTDADDSKEYSSHDYSGRGLPPRSPSL